MIDLINSSWYEIVVLSCAVQGVFLVGLLLLNKYPSSSSLSFVVISSVFLLSISLLDFPLKEALLLNTLLLLFIALWRYVKTFFSQKTRVSFLPFLILPVTIPLTISEGVISEITKLGLIPALILMALILIRKVLSEEGASRGISWFSNPGARLIWVRNFIAYHALFGLLAFPSSIELLPIGVLPFLVLIQIYFIFIQLARESSFLSPLPAGNKYQKSTLTPEQKAHILKRLDVLITEEKFYLNSEVSLSSLANALKTTTHHLSQVLNESRKQSFQDLITQLRIREAKRLLKDDQHQNTKIESIATMVGYNSKSAFNTAFKKYTNLTPREFRLSKNVLTYRDERLPDRKRLVTNGSGFDLSHGFITKTRNIMISNFMKIFFRRVGRNKLFSTINIMGLTVGFTCSMLIYLFINEHIGFDQELPGSSNTYRVAWLNENPQTRVPHPMAQAMKQDFPEVVAATSLSPMYGPGLTRQAVRVENKDENIQFVEKDLFYVDSTFLDVFQLKVIAGDAQALHKPWNVVISTSTAQKYFGDQDPIGKELTIDDMPIQVAAVVEDLPKKSHFHFAGLISYVTLKAIGPENPWMTWEDFGHFNYIRLKPESDHSQLESKIPEWIVGYLPWSQSDKEMLLSREIEFKLQPVNTIHLHSHLRWELENNANILYIYILTGALGFILLIVCINYINLTTAKSIERAREIGVRKTLGALSSGLRVQFYLESFTFCFIAVLLAFGLAALLLPFFNQLTNIDFQFSDLFQFSFLVKTGLAITIISILSGLYPAFVMGEFQPLDVLKGKLTTSFHGRRVRNGLVVFQFFVSSILIIASLIILRQLDFMKTKELGFDQEALISIRMYPSVETGGINIDKVRTLENEFRNVPGVKEVSAISNLPGGQFDQLSVFLTDKPEERIDASQLAVDLNGLETLGVKVSAGRTFNRSQDNDSINDHYIINQVAADRLNLENPVGTSLSWSQGGRSGQGIIVGVSNDFHYQSLHQEIQPLVMYMDPYDINHVIVKLDGRQFQKTLAGLHSVYAEQSMFVPFAYEFLDEQLAELYKDEIRTLDIFIIFTSIALILACIGLIGLAIAMLNQSTKEIGIRKIMGARPWDIFTMILWQFLKLIGVALLFGLPIGYLIMQTWISEFSYQASIGALPFIVSAVVVSVIAMMSVSVIIIRIANTNPADTLRYE